MNFSANALTEQLMIPDLLHAAPEVRPILDRYGLRGCGGEWGPRESVGFFARAHDVPIGQLLSELRSSLDVPTAPPDAEQSSPSSQLADTIYRPFFKAGISVVLTLGAVWGAYLLMRIALHGSFSAAGIHEVNAHGHAQIFGWVGLFVMGFAYQAFPRFKHTSLSHPWLAHVSLGLMLGGIVGRSVCEPLAATTRALIAPTVAASALEVVAIGLFVGIVIATWRRSGKSLAVYDYYILSALAWFVIQAVYETVYVAATLTAAAPDQLLSLVATWQAPLRDIQIHGFALLMILGVSQRVFPHFYGFPAASARRAAASLVLVNGAVLAEVLGLVLMRKVGHGWAGLWYAAVLALASTVLVLVWRWRIFSHSDEADRSLKFLRTAYIWLFISLGMLVLLPVYQYALLPHLAPESNAARIGFSHAYYGAIRHAITVGFISLMIVGVSAKVVPTLNGVDVRALPALWVPFLLINTGCTLRVFAQTLTDFSDRAFPLAGGSGILEVLGLAFWGVHLWRIMNGQVVKATVTFQPVVAGEPITGAHCVADILDRYPELRSTFLGFGFTPLASPLLRRTLARAVSIERACRYLNVDLAAFLKVLNGKRRPAAARIELPIL
jgi:ABC-type amino acid transport system permease subunit